LAIIAPDSKTLIIAINRILLLQLIFLATNYITIYTLLGLIALFILYYCN
jgi:hypothetical protein